MYCSACGQQVQPNQLACPNCGRPVNGAVQAVPQQVRSASATAFPGMLSRVERHAHTLAILWLVYAGWLLITWAFAASFFAAMFGMHRNWGPTGPMGPFGSGFPFGNLSWLLPFVTLIMVARAALAILTGIALLRRERWGRTLALVAGFLTLIKPLTGTLLGIYTLWVLLPAESGREYEQLSS